MLSEKTRKYTEKHMVRTILLQELYNIRLRLHYVNGRLKEKSVLHDFINKNDKVGIIKNFKTFESSRKKCHYVELVQKEIFFDLDENIEPQRIVFCHNAGHVLFDYRGNPIPTLYRFDYIGTPFHNEALHLHKAIGILKKHKDVVSVSEIEDLPYYSGDDYKTKFIHVDILPNKDLFRRIYKKFFKEDKTDYGAWSVRMKEYFHDGYRPSKKANYLGLWPDAIRAPMVED